MKLDEILKPKTESEIAEGLSKLSPDEKLIQCASNGYMVGIKEALSENANINYKLEKGDTPLDLAAFGNHYNTCEYLIQNGAWVSDISLGYSVKSDRLFMLMLNNLPLELCNCNDLKWSITVAIQSGRPDRISKMEDRIVAEGSLTPEDRSYLDEKKLEADEFTKFFN